MKKEVVIPKGFLLGSSSSAWQTEGQDGKKGRKNYLDMWYEATPELWHDGYGPAVATNFYHRYKEDIDLMEECGIQIYRTSIDWTRLIKNYDTAEVDVDAVQYYNNMINYLLEKGIVPMICLEHYEVPKELFTKHGGWGSKYVVECFVKYAQKAFELFGDRVKYWATFNEPIVVQTRAYLDALRWPFEQNTKKWMQWNYNKILANAKVVKLYHALNQGGKICIILNPEVTYPRSTANHDRKAAYMYDLYFNRIFMDPCMKGTFPADLLEDLQKQGILFDYTEEELKVIRENRIDFVGMNLYYPNRVQAPHYQWNEHTPFHPACYYDKFELPGRRYNPSRGWEIYPKIIYDMAMRLKNEYDNMEWMLTESGMGVMHEEKYENAVGEVQDDYRIEFLSEALFWVMKALKNGSNCTGFLVWAFTDCVSPMNAFKNRYGLVRIDLEHNRERRIKKSGRWYKQLNTKRKFFFYEMDKK